MMPSNRKLIHRIGATPISSIAGGSIFGATIGWAMMPAVLPDNSTAFLLDTLPADRWEVEADSVRAENGEAVCW